MDIAFLQAEFFGLTLSSVLLPVVIFVVLIRTRKISHNTVMGYALLLILLSAIDVVLLRRLAAISLQSASHFDDAIFASEISFGLYLLPVLSAGVGVNLLSNTLISHLREAQERDGR